MGEEIKDPRRNLPRALLLAGLIVTGCYIVGTIAILLALPSGEVSDLQGIMQAVVKTAERLGWFHLIPITAALIAIGNIGAASGFWPLPDACRSRPELTGFYRLRLGGCIRVGGHRMYR